MEITFNSGKQLVDYTEQCKTLENIVLSVSETGGSTGGKQLLKKGDLKVIAQSLKFFDFNNPENKRWFEQRQDDMTSVIEIVNKRSDVQNELDQVKKGMNDTTKKLDQIAENTKIVKQEKETEELKFKQQQTKTEENLHKVRKEIKVKSNPLLHPVVRKVAKYGRYVLVVCIPVAGNLRNKEQILQNCFHAFSSTQCPNSFVNSLAKIGIYDVVIGFAGAAGCSFLHRFTKGIEKLEEKESGFNEQLNTLRKDHEKQAQSFKKTEDKLTKDSKKCVTQIKSSEKKRDQLQKEKNTCRQKMSQVQSKIAWDIVTGQIKTLKTAIELNILPKFVNQTIRSLFDGICLGKISQVNIPLAIKDNTKQVKRIEDKKQDNKENK